MSSRTSAAIETGLIAVGFVVLWFFMPHWPKGDDWTRLNDVQQLIDHGHLTSSRYSLAGPILAAPFVELGEHVATPWYWFSRFNLIVVGVAVFVAHRLLRGRLDARLFRRIVLLLLFGSLLTYMLREAGAEIVTAALVIVGMLAVGTGRHVLLGWAAIVYGVVNTPATVVGLLLVCAFASVRTRQLRNLLPTVAALVLIGAEAWLRRGSPFTTGYHGDHGATTILPYSGRPGFSFPFVLGVVAILFSFGRGLLFYVPGLFLWLSARTRRLVPSRSLATAMMLFVGGLVVAYAKWWAWFGGPNWGPRFFVFAAIPASVFVAVRIRRAGESFAADTATLGVLLLSGWISFVGGTVDLDKMETTCGQVLDGALCDYTPERSSLWAPFLSSPHLSAGEAIFTGYVVLVIGYLAAPLVAAISRRVADLPRPAEWAAGWRI